MDKLIKVLEKIVKTLKEDGFTVAGNSNYIHGEFDDVYQLVEDDGERCQWFASVEVTGKDSYTRAADLLSRIFGVPTYSDKDGKVNNWTTARGYVLVVHSTNGIDIFEDYTKVSKKVTPP